MDIVKCAEALGLSAAIMDTANLVFRPEYRTYCEENLCGNYGRNPACPPESGTAEKMIQKALRYEKTLVLQTACGQKEDYLKIKREHNQRTEALADQMKEAGITDLLIMSAGPYRHHSCMSAYCVDAQSMADAVGMICWAKDGKARCFSQILFRE